MILRLLDSHPRKVFLGKKRFFFLSLKEKQLSLSRKRLFIRKEDKLKKLPPSDNNMN